RAPSCWPRAPGRRTRLRRRRSVAREFRSAAGSTRRWSRCRTRGSDRRWSPPAAGRRTRFPLSLRWSRRCSLERALYHAARSLGWRRLAQVAGIERRRVGAKVVVLQPVWRLLSGHAAIFANVGAVVGVLIPDP